MYQFKKEHIGKKVIVKVDGTSFAVDHTNLNSFFAERILADPMRSHLLEKVDGTEAEKKSGKAAQKLGRFTLLTSTEAENAGSELSESSEELASEPNVSQQLMDQPKKRGRKPKQKSS